MYEQFPEEQMHQEELAAREDAQRRADEIEEYLSFLGTAPNLPPEDEPFPF
jgi:hypothetical protein